MYTPNLWHLAYFYTSVVVSLSDVASAFPYPPTKELTPEDLRVVLNGSLVDASLVVAQQGRPRGTSGDPDLSDGDVESQGNGRATRSVHFADNYENNETNEKLLTQKKKKSWEIPGLDVVQQVIRALEYCEWKKEVLKQGR